MPADFPHAVTSEGKWYTAFARYETPSLRKAVWQLINTFVPYLALWGVMGFLVLQGYPYWATLALTVPAAALFMRIFIFFHDCCHGSYFASDRANRILGYICGVLTFTPFEDWRRAHAAHHATAGDLDRRGTGDVWTMTVREYLAASPMRRVAYRILRNPIVMFGLVPAALSLVCHRFPHRGAGRRERRSVAITNLAIAGILGVAGMTIGVGPYLSIQLPVAIIAGTVGVWLFYIQHQFEGVYWSRHGNWDPLRAALEGSSYYKLPKLLQWCTGSIGLHHIHHARPGVPNYNLQRCHDGVAPAQAVEPLTLWKSLRSLRMNLWDEQEKRLVSFRSVKKPRGRVAPQ
jgi:acyl-lipid omega-6 desaturase (Delta-12 desaturase)